MKISKLFYTPVFHIEAEDHDISITKSTYNWAMNLEKLNTTQSRSNVGGFHSPASDKFDLLLPEALLMLQRKLSFLPDMELINWWININRKGDYNLPHTHPEVDLAVVYYLTKNHGSLILQHPSLSSRSKFIQFTSNDLTEKIIANAGDIIIFPGDLSHYVEPQKTEEARVSMAINFKFKSTID